MNKRGFTLVELIGVITIMALIMLVVFPSTIKLLNQNAQRKYKNYYDMIEEAAILYSNTRTDDLGGTDGSGCVEVTLDDLRTAKYIKSFDDSEITCQTPTDAGKTKIRIINNKGTLTTYISLVCKKGAKVVYSNVQDAQGSCVAYMPEVKEGIFTKLYASLATSGDLTIEEGSTDNFFVTGSNPNNYVYYSGNLWRVISMNTTTKTMKLLSNEAVGITTYDKASSAYNSSNIATWLNNEFYNSLRTPDNYLYNDGWNYTTVTTTSKPASTNLTTSRVGLLTLYEYSKIGSYKNNGTSWWLISPNNATASWYASNTGTHVSAPVNSFFSVRPVITLQPNITYVGSATNAGTNSNPYRLIGEGSIATGTMLNTRYSGEYINFHGEKYRIVTKDENYTKAVLAANSSLGNYKFDETYYEYSPTTTLGTLLTQTWYNTLTATEKDMLYSGDWCVDRLTTTSTITSSCQSPTNYRNMIVGLPKVGELYTSGIGEYWTITNQDDNNVYVVTPTGTLSPKALNTTSNVRPSIYLKNDVKITSGQGTIDSPFEISNIN